MKGNTQFGASFTKKNRLPIFQSLSSSGENENTSISSNERKTSDSPSIQLDQEQSKGVTNIIQILNFSLSDLDNLRDLLNNITTNYNLILEELGNK